MSTYAIGDLHGCHAEFVALLDQLSFNPARDTLWLVGDLINRGPASLECLREVRALGSAARTVLGNHDFHLLVVARGGGKLKKNDTMGDILSAPDREALLDWLQSLPLSIREGDTVMTHAGLLPHWSVTQAEALGQEVQKVLASETSGQFFTRLFGNQPDIWHDDLDGMERLRLIVNVFTRMRFIDAQGRLDFAAKEGLESVPEGFLPWFHYPRADDAQLLFGHWAALEGKTPGARVPVEALDTGCVWGGRLTALNLTSGERTSVPSQQQKKVEDAMEKSVTETHADSRLMGLQVYRVGGAVRDALLGWPVYDNDWVVVGATPEDMRKRGFKPVGRDFPVFLHPDTAEEYALARTERKSGHGYAGFEVHASPDVTLEDDLLRRDLTINAIAESTDGALTDPFDGRGDIGQRVLRHISSAFSEDPLRVLRTARFLARYASLGFSIAPETLALMRQVSQSGELEHLAAERVWVETEKALGEPRPEAYFTTLKRCDALVIWWPELEDEALAKGLAAMAQAPAVSHTAVAHWRYAQLVSPLSDEQREALAERLKLPNAVSQLARHTALTYALLDAVLSGPNVLYWLERLDGWRKPAQVEEQLALVNILAPEQVARLDNAWQAARKVSPQALIAEGYQGAALGEALRERRGQAVAASCG